MIDYEKEVLRAELLGSFLDFCRFFFKVTTNRDFIISKPTSRESHHIIIARQLTRAFNLELNNHRLIINVPPGHGKSMFMSMWVAWCMAHYPDSNFLYISYAKTVAAKHTEFIKRVMSTAQYKYLFDVHLMQDSRAKDLFKTTQGGTVGAFGSAGAIVGQDAGLPGLDRFSGANIIDDAHKIDEAHSDTLREKVIENYRETVQQRPRGVNVPSIYIGQRVHEGDLGAFLADGEDGYEWEKIILKGIDDAGNALYPEAFPLESLLIKKERDKYVFAAQYQQDPIPAGNALYSPNDFVLLDEEPEMLATFITADTAETDKTYNDATVFSFFGIYQIKQEGLPINQIGLHWIDCWELRVEPKDLESSFMDFYGDCMRYPIPPKIAAIENKSTGVTLSSVLSDLRCLTVRRIEVTASSGSKSQRFIDMQSFVAQKLISLPETGRHTRKVLDHMVKITANNTHRHDDIADTLYWAIHACLIKNQIPYNIESSQKSDKLRQAIKSDLHKKLKIGTARYGNRQI